MMTQNMDLQNQTTDEPGTPLLNFKPVATSIPPADEVAPKARKPYTITKQREKWTDEEHYKFLEALKLYGRAWRQIEEFIGTKTAVQIRSHAQKFFSKVVRGGNDSTDCPVEAIEIPPPRPKRKPTHPYPRKLVDSQNNVASTVSQPEKKIRSHLMTNEAENRSPTSVLLAARPHMFEIPVIESPESCLSSSSCSTDLHSEGLFSTNNEDIQIVINSFQNKEQDSLPQLKRSEDNSAEMKICMAEETNLPMGTIMLFGQIVSTKDSWRPSAEERNNTSTPSQKISDKNSESKHEKLDESLVSYGVHIPLSHGLCYGGWRPWSFQEVKLSGADVESREAKTDASLKWLPLAVDQGVPPPYVIANDQGSNNCFTDEGTFGRENQNETYHASVSSNCSETEERTPTVNSLHSRLCWKDIASPARAYKSGFMPYKRCSATGSSNAVKSATDDEDSQRVQLCL